MKIPYDPWSGGYAKPGTWHGDGTRTVSMCCPKCKKIAFLSDHTISADGMVHPSVVCPRTRCRFHEVVQLEGWKKE